MGGRGNRRSNNGRKNSNGKSRPNIKYSSSSSGRRKSSSLFVEGGILSDFGRDGAVKPARGGSSSTKSRCTDRTKDSASNTARKNCSVNAIPYQYPSLNIQEGVGLRSSVLGNNEYDKMDESCHNGLLDSSGSTILTYVDRNPSIKSQEVSCSYEYHPSFALDNGSHRGLGFYEEPNSPRGVASSSKHIEDQDPLPSGNDMEAEGCNSNVYVAKEAKPEISSKRNSGFISIGSMQLYTEDISEEEGNEVDDFESEYESSMSSETGESETSYSDGTEDTDDSDSDIDDEVVEDYLNGIGGSESVLKAKWWEGEALDEKHHTSSSSALDSALKRFSGIAIEETSIKHYTKKSQENRIYRKEKDAGTPASDDLMLFKDPRNLSKKKKKHAARFPQSWPSAAVERSKNSRRYPGEKKKHRKEMIAVKRRNRMLQRGVDLREINLTLEQIVFDGTDMHCFEPMHHRDCSQVRRLAAIYRLSSHCKNSGKKKFVTVRRTHQTCMPSANDRLRLEKLIGARDADSDFVVNEGLQVPRQMKSTKIGKRSGLDFQQSSGKSMSSKSKQKGKRILYADQPVPFVSCGSIHSEALGTRSNDQKDAKGKNVAMEVSESGQFGAFEVHTKGFGSKMMARMGFEGGGLGKEGQGIAEPIQVVQRPRSLGLGIDFSEGGGDTSHDGTESKRMNAKMKHVKMGSAANSKSGSASTEAMSFGAFEKYTRGFGSKMMARMGFVEGKGLGRMSQGIKNPLVAVRRPKARGLGANI